MGETEPIAIPGRASLEASPNLPVDTAPGKITLEREDALAPSPPRASRVPTGWGDVELDELGGDLGMIT